MLRPDWLWRKTHWSQSIGSMWPRNRKSCRIIKHLDLPYQLHFQPTRQRYEDIYSGNLNVSMCLSFLEAQVPMKESQNGPNYFISYILSVRKSDTTERLRLGCFLPNSTLLGRRIKKYQINITFSLGYIRYCGYWPLKSSSNKCQVQPETPKP